MNLTKRTSRLLDLCRRGVRVPDLDGPELKAALGVEWPEDAERCYAKARGAEGYDVGTGDLRNATQRPNTLVDRKLRHRVSRLRWKPELKRGRTPSRGSHS